MLLRSTRTRLLLVFMAGFLTLFLIGVYGLLSYRNLLAQMSEEQQLVAEQVGLAKEIEIHYSQQNLAWANILLRGDDPAEYHRYLSAFYENERQTLTLAVQLVDRFAKNEQLHAKSQEFLQSLQQLRPEYRQALRLYNASPDTPQATDKFLSAITKKPTDALEEISRLLVHQHATTLQELELRGQQKEIVIAVVSVGTLVALFLFMLWYIDENFAKPMTHAIETAKRVSAGMVTERIQINRNDEFGTFAEAFNLMLEKLANSNAALENHVVNLRAEVAKREEVEQALRVEQQTLASVIRELEAFSYSVSHDLRAPLRAIDGFSQALIEDYGKQLDDSAQHYLKRVRSGAQVMGTLIDDLLKLSRVARGPLQRDEIDLSAMAQDVIAQLCHGEPERDIHVDIAEGMHAQGDPGLLHIVLENLIGNAWKYTGKTAAAQIAFDSEQRDGETVYRVRDNGAGFDMKYADKLFGAFQRLHRPEEFPGTGIGLATVARIIHRHGGRIWVEAVPGQGATFWFTLAAESRAATELDKQARTR